MKKSACLLLITMALFVLASSNVSNAKPSVIPWGKLQIDGKPDANLDKKTVKFHLELIAIPGSIKDPAFFTFLAYDAENIYFACQAKDDVVSSKDAVTRDFKDSDYIRFYINVGGDFKGRTTLNGKTDWAIIFTPTDTKDKWKPMVKECPYNGPGHGAIEGDDITPDRASGAVKDGWYVEAAIPFSLFDKKLKDLEKTTLGVYFIGGDTDKNGVRTGEVRVPANGAGNYWNSPDYWQEAEFGPFLVDPDEKMTTTWATIKSSVK